MASDSGGSGGPLFFLGFLGLFVLIWLSTGGPARPGSWTGPFLTAPTDPTAREVYSFPRAPLSVAGDDTGREQLRSAQQDTADLAIYGEPSVYRGHVEISKVELGPVVDERARDERKKRDAGNERITLKISTRAEGPIDISGFAIASGKYKERTLIPYGVTTFIIGQTQAAERIVVQPGDEVIVVSGTSPLGVSFRENKCTGYLAQYQDFTPPLSSSCPGPRAEFDRFYTGPSFDANLCRDHVASIRSCHYESYVPRQLPAACKPFVDQYLHHNGCVVAHAGDTDFASDTWRVYLGKSRTLYADTYETIRLLDASGRIVDVYAY